MKPEKEPPTYTVRRIHLEKTEQLDTLAHACGEVYTTTVVSFWRTVRKKDSVETLCLWTASISHPCARAISRPA